MNPMAGKGTARKTLTELERLLPGLGFTYETTYTSRAGHATEIARTSSSAHVVAVGGDGTINEVANGIIGSGKVLGIIPTGSGNDFIKSMAIPRKLRACLEILKARNVRRIDAGRVACATVVNGSTQYAPGRFFVNGVGIGFDASVARRVSEISYLRGTLLYLVAVLQTLGRYKPPSFRISVDGNTTVGKRLLVAIGNGRCAGGGFYLTPDAIVDDGKLDVCAIQDVPVMKILRLIPAVMSGRRVEDPAVSYSRMANIEVVSTERFNVHADGEVVGREVSGVKLEVAPSSLNVIGPRG
jgi:diacylglycerol kinase (ATP)